MSNTPSLKEQNAWLMRAVILLHAIVFVYVAFEPFTLTQLGHPDVLLKFQKALAPGTLSLAVIAIARLVLLGLIPSQLRDRLIHWRRQHPLPGTRAFTQLGPADPRIDMDKLEATYGPLPTDPVDQGRLFYRIYNQHTDAVGVLDAHRSYLAARDIAMIHIILLLPLSGLAWWATGNVFRSTIYAGMFLVAYILTAYAAQSYATRLVENALATASTQNG